MSLENEYQKDEIMIARWHTKQKNERDNENGGKLKKSPGKEEHVLRREGDYVGRRAMGIEVRGRGRQDGPRGGRSRSQGKCKNEVA